MFGDNTAGSSASRPPFLPYNSATVFDAPIDDPHERQGNNGLPGRQPIKSLTGTPGFDFDEDDEEQIRERQSAASRASGKLKNGSARAWDRIMQGLGISKRIEVGGERTIYINDQGMNAPFKYCNNYVSTGKYNLVTFIPKFLAGKLVAITDLRSAERRFLY